MRISAPFLDYLFHFHADRDYFECHEVLEEHWKQNGMQRKSIWVGLIQVAVAFYHYRRGNRKGAVKMLQKALEQLAIQRENIYSLGVDYDRLIDDLQMVEFEIQEHVPYKAYHLPIYDQPLLTLCKTRAAEAGYEWEANVDNAPAAIVHKHITRDRTEVEAEREQALFARRTKERMPLSV
ncbi:DUF309 domain-containing protein [Bacillus sp. FJAT-50079]|uniref:DUF309 domain-containing protein n=1 Tax=Bacillus sp. FJAT-50079 TaxID=2833577 RepID=UPI001BC9B196|nr:DUF309 domain-containing protein [Bacillus sp. FJAT-50079]MBS4209705.1 DUF309 domain-containing protein [Bacillus sp. FJAT-50079]